jgi:hypothetical protein
MISYPLCVSNISIRWWTRIVLISLFIGVFFPFGQLLKMLPNMEFLERIQVYSFWEEYAGRLGVFSNITVVKSLFIGLTCLYFHHQLQSHYAFKTFLDIYLFSLCWLVIFNDFGIVAARIATFFSIGEVLLCTSLYTLFSKRSKYVCAFLLWVFALLMLSLHVYTDKLFEYKMI